MSAISTFELQVMQCSRTFSGKKPIFPPIDLTLTNQEIKGITGNNGSGKSTLVKMIAGLLQPSTGTISLKINDKEIDSEHIPMHCGLVSPYLHMYEEYSPREHARLFCDLSGIPFDEQYHESLLKLLGMNEKGDEYIRTFSSGMKQRIKYALALIRKPHILLLDEPTANFDEHGIEAFKNIIALHIKRGGGIIIATNESQEAALCDKTIALSSVIS